MFSLKEFVKSGLLKAVGKMADYQVILNAAGWLEKGVLTEDDLAEIDTAISAQYPTETISKIETVEEMADITHEKIMTDSTYTIADVAEYYALICDKKDRPIINLQMNW